MNSKRYFLLGISILIAQVLMAQMDKKTPLFLELKAMDSLLFEVGFNECRLAEIKESISDDLIFYHDQSGIQDKALFFENISKYVCSDAAMKPIRKLVEEKLEVFPLYTNGTLYGAIQQGEHLFYIKEKDKAMRHTNTAKFTHTWLLLEGHWILEQVLSYDHQAP